MEAGIREINRETNFSWTGKKKDQNKPTMAGGGGEEGGKFCCGVFFR